MIKYGCGLSLHFLSVTGTVLNENRLTWFSCLVLNEGRSICGAAVCFKFYNQFMFLSHHCLLC